ncbi:hypothetical protein FA95DRAFT_1552653 [Auriscalpium vulgare]|uniref:Uncharacterized protein n=1 Tax=Auriscalpium vulgare TaxID=40419 RepID=A0ACB8S968_9AGAM|nr:hypothetical protein FA95DRAFT_1552653 [Auriscalpium vulgare]
MSIPHPGPLSDALTIQYPPAQLEPATHTDPAPRPPLLFKVTGQLLLTPGVILAFGVPKAVLSYRGENANPTTLDFVFGVICAIA